MSGSFELLKECMDREKQILEKITDLSLAKRQVIILGDVKELDAMIRKEGSLITALNKIESERMKYQIELGKEHSVAAGKLTASEMQKAVIDRYYSDHSQAFKELIESMTDTMKQIKEMNQLNAELLNHSLAYIESLENILSRVNSTVYSSEGTVEGVQKQHKILDKSV